jgi:16S rRNA (guanine527-N7)-methyltransferase
LPPPDNRLTAGLECLGIESATDLREQLWQYLRLLEKWNRVYNLTAVRDPQEMVTRHILDSLAIASFVAGPRVLDVGTGAGLPGIPLALVLGSCRFVLLDARAKKLRFVTQAVAELGLDNIEVVRARVETFKPAQPFDTVIARAFASIAQVLEKSGHLCAAQGRILVMKGARPQQELRQVPAPYTVTAVEALQVPGLAAQRHLVVITRN